mgnify:FL=1
MAKNLKLTASLVKKNQLIRLLKIKGVKRFNKKALEKLSYELEKKAEDYAELLARKLMLEGRKTLIEKDIIFAEDKKTDEFEI